MAIARMTRSTKAERTVLSSRKIAEEGGKKGTIKHHGLVVGKEFVFYGWGNDVPNQHGRRATLISYARRYYTMRIVGTDYTFDVHAQAKIWAAPVPVREVSVDLDTMAVRKQRFTFDRSTADAVLMGVSSEYRMSDIATGAKLISEFLEAWYADPSLDMTEFGRRWVAERVAGQSECARTDEDASTPQRAAQPSVRDTRPGQATWGAGLRGAFPAAQPHEPAKTGAPRPEIRRERTRKFQVDQIVRWTSRHDPDAEYGTGLVRIALPGEPEQLGRTEYYVQIEGGALDGAHFYTYEDELTRLPVAGDLVTVDKKGNVGVLVESAAMFVNVGLPSARRFRYLRADDGLTEYPRQGWLVVLIVGAKLDILQGRVVSSRWSPEGVIAMALEHGQDALNQINLSDPTVAEIKFPEDLYLSVVDPEQIRLLEA